MPVLMIRGNIFNLKIIIIILAKQHIQKLCSWGSSNNPPSSLSIRKENGLTTVYIEQLLDCYQRVRPLYLLKFTCCILINKFQISNYYLSINATDKGMECKLAGFRKTSLQCTLNATRLRFSLTNLKLLSAT